jgi:hypothetical protein
VGWHIGDPKKTHEQKLLPDGGVGGMVGDPPRPDGLDVVLCASGDGGLV